MKAQDADFVRRRTERLREHAMRVLDRAGRCSHWSSTTWPATATRCGTRPGPTASLATGRCKVMGRGDLLNVEWARLKPYLPNPGQRGGRWARHRGIINGILHRQRTGPPWRELPGPRCPQRSRRRGEPSI
ncbi:transposase [Streptomyces aureoverticillatus]|nr:transposase [Streptomyces aureoverticillatus]